MCIRDSLRPEHVAVVEPQRVAVRSALGFSDVEPDRQPLGQPHQRPEQQPVGVAVQQPIGIAFVEPFTATNGNAFVEPVGGPDNAGA